MSLSNEQIVDAIAAKSLMEVMDLVKAMEEKFGVSAAAPVAVAAGPAAGAAGRLIKEFAKGNDKLKAKVVSVEGKLLPAAHVEVLASLPTREQALAMLARVLAEPAAMFARAVKAVADKQGGGEAPAEAPAEAEASA